MGFSPISAASKSIDWINVKDYGAVGDYDYSTKTGTDDTTAIQNAINDAQGNSKVLYIPEGYYKISGTLTVSKNLTIVGAGAYEVVSSISNGLAAMNMPITAPYFTGSVIVQTANATDAIQLTGLGQVANMRDFALLFDLSFTNTGHGINNNPPLVSGQTYNDSGLWDSTWENIKVYGHDGNHYAFVLTNALYNTYTNLRSYGGGHMWVKATGGGTGGINSGNFVCTNSYGVIFVGGSAHGIYLNNQSGQTAGLNLFTFVKPQMWVQNASVSGVTAPTSSQSMLYSDSGITGSEFINVDFESNVGSNSTPPNGGSNSFSIGTANGYVSHPFPIGNPTSGTAYQNTTGFPIVMTSNFTLNPTSGAAASVTVYTNSTSSNMTNGEFVVNLGVPAAGPTGIQMSAMWLIPAGYWYQMTLTNATRDWTTSQQY